MLKEPNIGNILFNRRYFYYYPRYQSYNQQKRYWPYRNYYNTYGYQQQRQGQPGQRQGAEQDQPQGRGQLTGPAATEAIG